MPTQEAPEITPTIDARFPIEDLRRGEPLAWERGTRAIRLGGGAIAFTPEVPAAEQDASDLPENIFPGSD